MEHLQDPLKSGEIFITSLFEFTDYRHYLKAYLGKTDSQKRNGSIKKLAEFIQCHPTYISQVINEKAHFSNEQAIAFCDYALLDTVETEYFINLLNRDRAGTTKAAKHFSNLIDRQLQERNSIAKRWSIGNPLSLEQSLLYYSSWIPQAVHMATQINSLQTPTAIAQALNLSKEKVNETLKTLVSIGVVKTSENGFQSVVDTIHLEKSSPLRTRVLANWRNKVIEDMAHNKDPNGITYSSAVSLSEEAFLKIKEFIHQQLEKSRDVILSSTSEKICVYNIDFYSITQKQKETK